MYNILGAVFIITFFALLAGTVIIKRMGGLNILVLGVQDRKELVFWVFYAMLLYVILSNATALPMPEFANKFFFDNESLRIVGVVLSIIGLLGYIVCVASFWNSFRLGVDYKNAGKLTTTGIYAFSRNPMYMGFFLLFLGEFLIFPNLSLLIAVIVSVFSIHVQVRREEKFCKSHYGKPYEDYCKKVRRYL